MFNKSWNLWQPEVTLNECGSSHDPISGDTDVHLTRLWVLEPETHYMNIPPLGTPENVRVACIFDVLFYLQ